MRELNRLMRSVFTVVEVAHCTAFPRRRRCCMIVPAERTCSCEFAKIQMWQFVVFARFVTMKLCGSVNEKIKWKVWRRQEEIVESRSGCVFDFTAAGFLSFLSISCYIYLCLYEAWWAFETWRKQTLSSKFNKVSESAGRRLDDDSQREKKLPSARSLWSPLRSPPCDGERNGGYFKQQARVERCPTACDSSETYRYNTSVGLETIPMWAAEEEEEGRQNFKTLKVILHDSFM